MLSCTLLNTKQQNDINEANNFKIQHTFYTYFMLSNSGGGGVDLLPAFPLNNCIVEDNPIS